MSSFETQLGWFFVMGNGPEVLCYRCNCCGLFQMFSLEDRRRAFCCGRWKEKPEEGFWAGKLPRIRYQAERGLLTLPGKRVTYDTDWESSRDGV
jgi:hypothetical protein